MGDRKLSLSEVSALVNKPKQDTRTHITAVDDIYRRHAKELIALMDEKVDSVVIGDVEVVATKRPDSDNMFIRPKEGFVPCGWVNRNWLIQQGR
jgi:hypothetical protein